MEGNVELSKITKLSTTTAKRTVNLLGLSGAGKTYQYRSLHEAGRRVLVASTEKKLATIADLEPEVWPIESFDWPLLPSELQAVSALFNAGSWDKVSDLVRLYKYLQTPDHPYDVCYLDSGMRLAEDMAEWFTRNTLTKQGEVDSLRGYGVFADKINTAFKAFMKLADPSVTAKPVHFIVTWGVEWVLDIEGRRLLQPIVDGKKFSPKIPYLFDDVIYLDTQRQSDGTFARMAGLCQTDRYYAKVSSGIVKLPPVVKDFNLHNFLCKFEAPPKAKGE
jgi:hypothetical protein